MRFSALSVAFALAPRLPLRWVLSAARAGARRAARRGGANVDQLRANLRRLTGGEPDQELVVRAVESHIRNYAEQLVLGSPKGAPLLERVVFEDFDRIEEASEDGPVVLALGHSGSWDRAGAWVCAHGRPVVTVAERVEPPSLFDSFVRLREGLGMEIIGVGKGESVFDTLVERVRGRSVLVPLLADRDISGAGIEVDFAGHRALVAAGPAALAHRLSRPLYAACVSYADEDAPVASVRVELAGPITAAPGGGANEVEALTQAWVDAFTGMLADKPEDWHMMQKVYTEDLDPERLARARAAHRSRGAGQ